MTLDKLLHKTKCGFITIYGEEHKIQDLME